METKFNMDELANKAVSVLQTTYEKDKFEVEFKDGCIIGYNLVGDDELTVEREIGILREILKSLLVETVKIHTQQTGISLSEIPDTVENESEGSSKETKSPIVEFIIDSLFGVLFDLNHEESCMVMEKFG